MTMTMKKSEQKIGLVEELGKEGRYHLY